MAAVPDEKAREVCKFGQGEETCAFLALSDGFECIKGTNAEYIVRERLADGIMKPKGDYCGGMDAKEGSCQEWCANSGTICSCCYEYDMANCRFDTDVSKRGDCRPRCTSPTPCEKDKTFYEQVGYVLS
ncbi:MAG: hypothetical protein WCV58_04215 [Patescibacteria group bacterium]